MAHPAEPMDIDNIDSDFDNKENTFHYNNVQPCTEKGYEELDVSELNMRLRYSVTPAASPMSKSYTSYVDNRSLHTDELLNATVNNNLTRSLNSTINMNDNVIKSLKSLPLQSLPTDQSVDRNVSALHQLDSTITIGNNDIRVTVSNINDIDENLSLPSSSSSAVGTPEATTPTKDIPKTDGGSPIMRGLKSVLNMFRSSQSPIPPPENENTTLKPLTPTPTKRLSSEPREKAETKPVLASTPISTTHRDRDANGSKRNSPLKDSVTFNNDLETELQWKDETTILFSQEKIPIHKLFYQQKQNKIDNKAVEIKTDDICNLDITLENMDISYNDSLIKDKTITEIEQEITTNEFHIANESDSEFVDCESDSNAIKTVLNIEHNKGVELNKESIGINKPMTDITLHRDIQEVTQQINETKRVTLNMTIPVETNNKQEISETNLITSSNQHENINITNELTLDNSINKTEENLNITKEINKVTPQITTEVEVITENSNPNMELNLDITMTMDKQDIENKSIHNVLEVSTLESHTKSLSSLIQSLDVTKSFEEAYLSIETGNLEKTTVNNSTRIPDTKVAPNTTITISEEEDKTFEPSNLPEEFTLDLPEHLSSSTIQNFDVTIIVDNQTEAEGNLDLLENKVDTNRTDETDKDVIQMTPKFEIQQEVTTLEVSHGIDKAMKADICCKHIVEDSAFNVYNEYIKDNLPMITSEITTVQEMTVQDLSQAIETAIGKESIPISASPADEPLPEDDDMEQDINIATDTCFTRNDEVNTIAGNAVETISEIKISDRSLPDMLLETNGFQNKNEITSLLPMEILCGKEEIIYSIKVDSEEIIQENQNIIENLELNINKTFDVQATNLNKCIDNKQILPDVGNESMNDIGIVMLSAPDSQIINSIGPENNTESSEMSINCINQLFPAKKEQKELVNDELQNNILPDNQMETSISACEEILDKNREISEMFLTEQKIDKLQHDSNVASSFHKVSDNSPSLGQNIDENEIISNIMKFASMEDRDIADHPPEDDTDVTYDLQDGGKTVTLEEHLITINNEQKDMSEQAEKNIDDIKNTEEAQPDQIETANNPLLSNEENVEIYALEKIYGEHDIVQSEEIVITGKIDDSQDANETIIVEDIKLVIDVQKDVAIDKLNQEDQLKAAQKDKEDINAILNDGLSEKLETLIGDDEILVSGNNSPYVSVAADLDKVLEKKPQETFEKIETPIDTKTEIPSSPPITSKGYNFNFDEIDDPFDSKVKIRMSPTHESPNKTKEIKKEDKKVLKSEPIKKDINKAKGKIQRGRQKISNTKKSFNSTFDNSVEPEIKTDIKTQKCKNNAMDEEKQMTPIESLNCVVASSTFSSDVAKQIEQIPEVNNVDTKANMNMQLIEHHTNLSMHEENKDLVESVTVATNDIKATSSSEQSTYYSAGASSSESLKSRNVFNLPEIDDMNFNPFATKSKIYPSPPHDIDINNPFVTKNKVYNSPDSSIIINQDNGDKGVNSTFNIATNAEKNAEDKMETEPMEKDTSVNISNTTNSSKSTDKEVTIREVNTEDEDTIEGPFLEAEDIEDKQCDFDGENVDMMQFNELPVPEHDENDGELFIDAEAFEFLLNQNKSNVVADSGKESLFLKFDPLFAKRMSSDSVVAALSRAQKRQSAPTRTPRQQRNLKASVAGPSTVNLTYEADPNTTECSEDVNTTVSKPTMVVTPAVNPTATLRKSVTPTRSNRRSITFTSPAMAVIDRLLSLSANNSFVEQESAPQVSREQNEAELALTQLREVLAEKEIHVYNLRSESKELKDRLTTLESQMKLLENEGQERLKKINDLNDKLSEKSKINKSMAVVVEEYERTIASLIAETEQDKKRHAEERIVLMNERDEQTAHLASMEVSFNDLHSKYEKSKQVIMNYKTNEESYKQSLKDFEENVSKMQKNYELLKQHATSKLNHANEELQKINRAHEAEVLKLNAMIKRKELHITSLEETLSQKTKANEELTAICDELINKVG